MAYDTTILKPDLILEQTYTVSNRVQATLQHKDWPNYNAFNTAHSKEMLSALNILQIHYDEIHNTFTIPYSDKKSSNHKVIRTFKI